MKPLTSRYQPSEVDEELADDSADSDPDDNLSRLDTELHIASDLTSFPTIANGSGERPRDGESLSRWAAKQRPFGLYDHLGHWGRLQGYPAGITNWTAEAVAAGYSEALSWLGNVGGVEPAQVAASAVMAGRGGA